MLKKLGQLFRKPEHNEAIHEQEKSNTDLWKFGKNTTETLKQSVTILPPEMTDVVIIVCLLKMFYVGQAVERERQQSIALSN